MVAAAAHTPSDLDTHEEVAGERVAW